MQENTQQIQTRCWPAERLGVSVFLSCIKLSSTPSFALLPCWTIEVMGEGVELATQDSGFFCNLGGGRGLSRKHTPSLTQCTSVHTHTVPKSE